MGHRQLSKRENQVLQCLSLGRTNKEIGQVLSIGEGTIKRHVKSILRKLNAIRLAQAIGIAIRRGVLHVGLGAVRPLLIWPERLRAGPWGTGR